MKTLVIGLGNPILGDDGVGWVVLDALQQQLAATPLSSPVELDKLSLGGLSLMERMVGYDQVVLVDAVQTGKLPEGSVRRCRLEDLYEPSAGHVSAAHDTSLMNALQVGRSLGASLPQQVAVVTIEAQRVYDFSEELSAPVAGAVPEATQRVLEILDELERQEEQP